MEQAAARGLRVHFHFHPYTQKLGHNHYGAIKQLCKDRGWDCTEGLTKSAMIDLFDSSEYAASDGSGSIYEAVARGCRGLSIDGLYYQRPRGFFGPTFEAGFMPRTAVTDLLSHPGAESDLSWLRSFHGASLVEHDLTDLMRSEILGFFSRYADVR
jgi:hypothetical protein